MRRRAAAPLRFATRQAMRAWHLACLTPRILRVGRGLGRTIRRAFEVSFTEGLPGVRRRVRYVVAATPRSDGTVAAGPAGPADPRDYPEWVRRYDTLDDRGRSAIARRAEALAAKPLISVLMPVFNPPERFLEEAIGSVRRQLYPRWELCIADDASTKPGVRELLEKHARADRRIKVAFRAVNGHIPAASNSALEMASGEWIALLDQDDLLAEHALFWLAEAVNRRPDAGIVYSDEDKVLENGERREPHFKCDWNVDLVRSQNMISHLGAYRTTLVREVGAFRTGFEGAQDYDLALRCSEKLRPGQIVHVPRVLYHWRAHPGSTALGETGDQKPYAVLGGQRALAEHLARVGIDAEVTILPTFHYRVSYRLPDPLPRVSLIIPTRNGLHLIQRCVDSILEKTGYDAYDILIVDNGSDDPASLAYLEHVQRRDGRVRVLRDDRPFNFSALNNHAAQHCTGDLLGLLNNDLEVISPDWLGEMVARAVQPGVGAVGARLWYPNDTLQHGGVVLGLGGVAGHAHKYFPRGDPGYYRRAESPQTLSAVSAACLVIRRRIFDEVGGFEEDNLKIAFNDVDFCIRVREAGYRNVWTPFAELYHHESASRGFEDTPEKQARFVREVDYMKRRWGRLLTEDPCYSPNLTLDREDFSFAWPPRVKS